MDNPKAVERPDIEGMAFRRITYYTMLEHQDWNQVREYIYYLEEKVRGLSVPPVVHGKNCSKRLHLGSGHLHGRDDDSPFTVDGVDYCGRCHESI